VAREFSGAADQYLSNTNFSHVSFTAMTVAAWVWADTLLTTDFRILAAKAHRTGNPSNWELHLRDGSSNGASGIWLIWFASGNFRWIQTTAQNAISTGQWTHVAAGFDGTNKKIWVNGVSQTVTDSSGGTSISTNTENHWVGLRGTGGPANERFDGKMAEYCLFNSVLSDAHVAALATGASPVSLRPLPTYYLPMYGGGAGEQELMNQGTPLLVDATASPHPRVHRPRVQQLGKTGVTGSGSVGLLQPRVGGGPARRPPGRNQGVPSAFFHQTTAFVPPQSPPPGGGGTRSNNFPLIARVPRPKFQGEQSTVGSSGLAEDNSHEARLVRFTEQVSSLLNDLIRRGNLQQTGPSGWTLTGGAFVRTRPPAATDDLSIGAFPGAQWVDTLAKTAWVCISAHPRAAIWKQIG
jgi:hypothetical protein